MSSGNPKTRKKILHASWQLLEAAQGREVRMSDIARNAGVSRQAVYLHFPTRSDLLIATTHHIDEVKNVDARLAKSRSAATGMERLSAFIEAWGNYIPEIYGVAKALIAMSETDDAAKLTWDDRMQAVRHGCRAAVETLEKEGQLASQHSVTQGTDILSALLSVQTWEYLTINCGWSQQFYIEKTKVLARQILVSGNPGS